jgi:hypothetical protein
MSHVQSDKGLSQLYIYMTYCCFFCDYRLTDYNVYEVCDPRNCNHDIAAAHDFRMCDTCDLYACNDCIYRYKGEYHCPDCTGETEIIKLLKKAKYESSRLLHIIKRWTILQIKKEKSNNKNTTRLKITQNCLDSVTRIIKDSHLLQSMKNTRYNKIIDKLKITQEEFNKVTRIIKKLSISQVMESPIYDENITNLILKY